MCDVLKPWLETRVQVFVRMEARGGNQKDPFPSCDAHSTDFIGV